MKSLLDAGAGRHSAVSVGIDVGGARKGFHCVALGDSQYLAKFRSTSAEEVAIWCSKTMGARLVGFDAPSRWSTDGRARQAERDLMREGVWCFSTPSRDVALNHPSNYYGWMLNGESLIRALGPSHPLFAGGQLEGANRLCFETFPHAIASSLAGKPLLAKNKRRDRRSLLEDSSIDIAELTSIDWVDAAMCALAAQLIEVRRATRTFGERATGWIVVPQS